MLEDVAAAVVPEVEAEDAVVLVVGVLPAQLLEEEVGKEKGKRNLYSLALFPSLRLYPHFLISPKLACHCLA